MQQTKTLKTGTLKPAEIDRDSWEVCDPDRQEDPLPMPYRLIDEVLNDSIMSQVYLGVHEIEKKKKDPNYEGAVRQLQSQGILELEGISCMTHDQQHSHLILGDRTGTIYVLDVSKKLILSKKQVLLGSRVEHLACSTYLDGEVAITSIAVVLRGHPNIYVLRYRSGEVKLFVTAQLNVSNVKATDASTDISSYPFECKFSMFGLHLAVSLYDGSVVVYELPEVTVNQPKEQPNKGQQPNSAASQAKIHPTYFATLDEPTVTIESPSLTIPFEGVEAQVGYKSLLESLKKKEEKPPAEPEVKKDSKKDGKKEEKKQQPKEEKKSDRIFNNKLLLGESVIDSGKDCSTEHEQPKYKPDFFFLSQSILPPRSKYFEELKPIRLSTKLLVGWRYTTQCNVYSFQQLNQSNLPNFLYQQTYQDSKKGKRTKLELKKVKELNNLYPMSCLAVSDDESLLGCGLKEGTVAVWDLYTDSLKYTLDKHRGEITHLCFFEVYRLLSGSVGGEVHLDDLVTAHLIMKRTNTFQSKVPYRIVGMQISNIGVALVMDSLGYLRMYDVWRGEKIAKLIPSTAYVPADGRSKKWFVDRTMFLCDDETLSVVSETILVKHQQELTPEEKEMISRNVKQPWRRTTQLQMFRLFENLIGLFEGLANVYRRGIDKDKVVNLFSNLELNQLNDKQFEIPRIGSGPEPQQTTGKFDKTVRPENPQQHRHQREASKRSDTFSESSSNTYKSRSNKPPSDPKQPKQQVGLTKEALHPQMHLFKRHPTPKIVNPSEAWLLQAVRESHNKKQHREATLLRQTTKQEGLH